MLQVTLIMDLNSGQDNVILRTFWFPCKKGFSCKKAKRLVCFLCAECDDEWKTSGEKCYKIFEEKKSWNASEASCEDNGAHLVKIESEEENTFLLRTFLEIPYGDVNIEAWIGLTDQDNEGEFVWADGTAAKYTNWADEQPNDEDNQQDCAEIANGVFWPGGPPQIGVWNDFQCENKLMYICEKSP